MSEAPFSLRLYAASDEEPAIELWRRTWQIAYPRLDFTARLDWWRARWRSELVPTTVIAVAEAKGALAGFVTVDPATGYLDQIVVAPESWGTPIGAALLGEAKRISPTGLDLAVNADNTRAISFYRKHGFAVTGDEVNPRSGAKVHRMRWQPGEPEKAS